MLNPATWKLGTRVRLLLRGLRYAPLLPYAAIDGWLSVDEAIALYDLAGRLPDERPLAVEIGSWQGRSSVVLGRALRRKRAPRLVCIDPFDASGDGTSEGLYAARAAAFDNPLKAGFVRNLQGAGVADLVDIRQGYSHDVARDFREPIDLLFLDGDHSYDSVLRDYRDWSCKVRPGGWLCMHDVRNPIHDGPGRVAAEVVACDPAWTALHYVDTMLVARRRGPHTTAGG
jgi:predicted O-methyltransferase YrrM